MYEDGSLSENFQECPIPPENIAALNQAISDAAGSEDFDMDTMGAIE